MRLWSLIALPLLLGSAPPLLAQGSAPDLPSAVALAEAERSVSELFEADLNLDGRAEALLLHDAGCEGGLCPWTLIGAYPDGSGWGPVAAGVGARTELVETVPSGHVIRSDGVILAWDGADLSPYFDLLGAAPGRRARPEETRLLGRLLPGSFRPLLTQAYEVDPFGSGRTWRLFTVRPNAEAEDPVSPYHLIGPEGELRHSGASLGRPLLYADQDEGGPVLRLVSRTGSGILVESAR